MKFIRCISAIFIIAGSTFTPGCSNPLNGNDSLTAEQQKAVDSAVENIKAMQAAMAGIVASFDGVDADANNTFGECPEVGVTLAGGVITLTLTFPTDCTNAYYGSSPLSGSITIAYDIAAQTYSVTFNEFTNSQGTFNGTMVLSYQRTGLIVSLVGTLDLTISGVGSTTGAITLQIDIGNGILTITDANLTLSPEGEDDISMVIADIEVRPIDNENFIPETGTITFETPNSGVGPETLTVVITFDGLSPIDRTVSVSINGGEPVEHLIGGGV